MSTASIDIADWISHGLTIVGIVGSVGVVLYQLGKQHRSSLKLQRNNAREELKLKVYEFFSEKARGFAEAELQASSYASSIPRKLDTQLYEVSIGIQPGSVELRVTRLMEVHYQASTALTDLIVALENWEIAFPAAELFRVALSSASQDVEETFHPFFLDAMRLLPTDMGEKGSYIPPLPTPEQLEEMARKAKAYAEARTTLRTYTQDLMVEAQNLLLSKLFKRRVAIRKPIDPSYKVITASNGDALMDYFQRETASGKNWEEAKSRVREFIRQRGQEPAA